MCKYLREAPGYQSWDRGAALPLGLKAGVPDLAAGVDLASVVATSMHSIAEQVKCPRSLLLPPAQRPELPRPFAKVDSSYSDYVRRCARVGLHRLVRQDKVFKVRRKPLISGAFAVAKMAQRIAASLRCVP